MATKKTTMTKTEEKVNVNGSHDFLVGHFAEPSSIIDAATALAGHSKIDSQIAVKKVEQFLENAKIDQSLEVRAGTGSNDGQYLITRVPQSAQHKTGGREVKATEKKATEKKATEKKATEKKATEKTMHIKVTEGTLRTGSKRGAAIQFWSTGYHTVDAVVEHLKKQFSSEPDAKLKSAATEIFRHVGLRNRLKVKVLKKEHGDTQQYTVVAA